MMNDDQFREWFAARYDGELKGERLRQFEARVAGCDDSAREWEAYRTTIDALRDRGPTPTGPELLHSVLAAVDADVPAPVARPFPVLPLALGIGLGAAAAAVLLLAWPGLLPRPEPEVREIVRTERVDVPVEVVRTERVEVPVEVVRVERVEVPMPTGAWIRVETGGLASAVDRLSDRLLQSSAAIGERLDGGLAQMLEELRRPSRQGASENTIPQNGLATAARRPALGPEQVLGPPGPSAESIGGRTPLERGSVRIRQLGERVQILTSGPMSEYVPILIARLDHSKPAVRRAIEDRLSGLHARASEDPELRRRLVSPRAAGREEEEQSGNIFRTGRRRARVVERSPGQRWAEWWDGNEQVLVAALD